MKPYNNDEFSNYLVESTAQFFDRYGKMYGEKLQEETEELDESSAGYTSREYATRREKDISRLKGKVGAYKKGAGPQDKAKDAMVSDIRAMRAQRKVTGDKLSGKEAENRKIQRLAQAKRMADKRRESEAASKKKGLASRAKSAIKKMFNKEDYNVYDVVLQYILDEGYAVSFQEAFGIMSELDEDTILDILEETGYEYIED